MTKCKLSTSEMNKLIILRGTQCGMFLWRNNTMGVPRDGRYQSVGGIHGGKGSPDIVGVNASGRFIGIEVKNSKDRMRPDQVIVRKMITDRSGLFFIVTPSNIEQFLKELENASHS